MENNAQKLNSFGFKKKAGKINKGSGPNEGLFTHPSGHSVHLDASGVWSHYSPQGEHKASGGWPASRQRGGLGQKKGASLGSHLEKNFLPGNRAQRMSAVMKAVSSMGKSRSHFGTPRGQDDKILGFGVPHGHAGIGQDEHILGDGVGKPGGHVGYGKGVVGTGG
jgi:hypothetical protein